MLIDKTCCEDIPQRPHLQDWDTSYATRKGSLRPTCEAAEGGELDAPPELVALRGKRRHSQTRTEGAGHGEWEMKGGWKNERKRRGRLYIYRRLGPTPKKREVPNAGTGKR